MRIGVTGGAGFIGQAVQRVAETEVVVYDLPQDVRDATAVDRFVRSVDGVIHLAGILGTSETLGHEWESISVNIGGALVVAEACQRHDRPLVQIGTGHKGTPNVYAVTKACAEDLILVRMQWNGLQANVVRAYNGYGPGQKAPPPYGDATVRKIIPAFVCAALAGDPLIVNGTGRQIIDLVHVDDIARMLISALEPPYGRLLEAGTGQPVTVLQAAQDVIEACESKSKIHLVPMRPGEPEMSEMYAKHGDPLARPWPSLDDTIAYYRQ